MSSYHSSPTSAAQAPPGCPVNHDWSPLSGDYLADPYPIADTLRATTPVFFAESIGHVVITKMADLDAVFRQPDVFASSNVQDPIFPIAPEASRVLAADDFDPVAVMSNRSQPDHGRIRVHTTQGFSNRRLATLEPFIVNRAHQLIDAMLDAGSPAELVQALAFPLPGETIFRFLGFPDSDDDMLKGWCGDRKSFSWGQPTPEAQADIAEHMLAYWRYCRTAVAHKHTERDDSFTSELLSVHDADPDQLTYREVESIVYGLSFAGHEAVTNLICNALVCLLSRPDQWAAVVADPTLVNAAVEEVLRFDSSQISWRRIAVVDTEVGGVAIPAGTPVFLNFASAHRDPDVFSDPWTFDLHRADSRSHIAFGKGIHFCLGAKMARLETRLVLQALAERLPSLRLVEGQALTTSPNVTFRGPEQLMVEWGS